jgi:DNA mismatch repair protein MutS2
MELNLLKLDYDKLLSTGLDWEQLTQKLTSGSHFSVTKEKLKSPPVYQTIDNINDEYNKIESVQDTILNRDIEIAGCLNQLPEDDSLERNINRLYKDAVLELGEIHEIVCLFEVLNDIYPAFDELLLALSHQDLKEVNRVSYKEFRKEFRSFINIDGDINYHGHPIIGSLFDKINKLEKEIRENIKYLQKEENYKEALQFNSYDILNDHFVLPIKTDSYKTSHGQIIGRSDSGQTLYVEPFSIKDKVNKRLELMAKLDEELHKLAIRYCDRLREPRYKLHLLLETLYQIDFYWAKSKFCLENRLNRPEVLNTPRLVLKQYFHPLIPSCIKNDLELSPEQEGVIISGPNTGGKTATLKMIALIQLLLHKGLFVPAKQAKIFPYKAIYYFGNDGQSLEEGLSSFSSEVTKYNHLIENLESSNIILIDEIFNSTSSEEASALAMGFLNLLNKKSLCLTFISTHHQMFKTFMHDNKNYLSCHVGFDIDNHKPTYKLHIGSPGNSMALDVFYNLTKNKNNRDQIISFARNNLDKKQLSYEDMLKKLSIREVELNKLIDENRLLNDELSHKEKKLEGLFNLKFDKELRNFKEKIKKLEQKALNLIQEIKSGNTTSKRSVYRQFSEISKELPKTESQIEHNLEKPEIYEPGKMYFSETLNQDVELEKINEKKKVAFVRKGKFSMQVPLSGLFQSRKKSPRPKADVHVAVEIDKDDFFSLDCRGMRLNEFSHLVEKQIAALKAGKIPYLEVIHGHGEGILKKWLRDTIRKDKEVMWAQDESGNDGATTIKLSN